jgi:hypothetical protein
MVNTGGYDLQSMGTSGASVQKYSAMSMQMLNNNQTGSETKIPPIHAINPHYVKVEMRPPIC